MPGSLLPGGGASVTGKPAAGQASSALADDVAPLSSADHASAGSSRSIFPRAAAGNSSSVRCDI